MYKSLQYEPFLVWLPCETAVQQQFLGVLEALLFIEDLQNSPLRALVGLSLSLKFYEATL